MGMQFNDCDFAGTVPSGAERRVMRPHVVLEANLFPEPGEDEPSDQLEVSSMNISRHGLSLDVVRDVPVGTVCNIEIGLHGRKVQSHVRITSCEAVADGLYRAGGEFC